MQQTKNGDLWLVLHLFYNMNNLSAIWGEKRVTRYEILPQK